MAREYRKCPSCGEQRHDLMYPWADPDADAYARPPRSDNPAALRRWNLRVEEAARTRRAAQAKGRDYSRCLPCVNGDTP
jgi:hypothetical protein